MHFWDSEAILDPILTIVSGICESDWDASGDELISGFGPDLAEISQKKRKNHIFLFSTKVVSKVSLKWILTTNLNSGWKNSPEIGLRSGIGHREGVEKKVEFLRGARKKIEKKIFTVQKKKIDRDEKKNLKKKNCKGGKKNWPEKKKFVL